MLSREWLKEWYFQRSIYICLDMLRKLILFFFSQGFRYRQKYSIYSIIKSTAVVLGSWLQHIVLIYPADVCIRFQWFFENPNYAKCDEKCIYRKTVNATKHADLFVSLALHVFLFWFARLCTCAISTFNLKCTNVSILQSYHKLLRTCYIYNRFKYEN